MYDLIIKILDKSREEKVDINVAYDKIAREDGLGYTEELKTAFDTIVKHYDFITKCRRENDVALLKAFCELLETGSVVDIRKFKEGNDD
jgi:hypothetical protein